MVGSRAPRGRCARAAQRAGCRPACACGRSPAGDDLGAAALREVSFEVRAGEIVGVAAVAGNGQEELVEVLAGQRPRSARRARGRRQRLPGDPGPDARAAAALPARGAAAAAPASRPCRSPRTWPSSTSIARPTPASAGGSRRGPCASAASASSSSSACAPARPTRPLGELSGGNVQRVVLARELASQLDVLVAANPCMGLDFTAVAEVHARLRQVRDSGAAVLLVSADLDEIFALADRILVMSEGRVVHETPAAIGRAQGRSARTWRGTRDVPPPEPAKQLTFRLTELLAASRGRPSGSPFHPGVEICRLYDHGPEGPAAAILRYAPGAAVPAARPRRATNTSSFWKGRSRTTAADTRLARSSSTRRDLGTRFVVARAVS